MNSLQTKTTKGNTRRPEWRALLHERGITDLAIHYAGIRANDRGWLYPIAPDVVGGRWKAYPNQRGAKYRWMPTQPDNARFYDPPGLLAQHVAVVGDNELILANGEPDSWVLFSAGLYDATCTLHGEGTIPTWFIDELHALEVRTVRLWPDCDNAGRNHARKVVDALADSGITVEVYALPYADDSKADLNTLWLDCEQDRDRFIASLESCPPLDLPDQEPPQQQRQQYTYTPPNTDYANLYEQWCIEVERAAVIAWNIAPPNGKNQSRKNFSSPLREDRDHSAQWNYSIHGFKDYGNGGEVYSTKQVAELLGMSWEDYKADHAPSRQPAPGGEPVTQDHPDHLYDQPRDPNVRTQAWHWTNELRELLLGLPTEENDRGIDKWPDMPDMRTLVMVLELVINAETTGRIERGAALSERDILELAVHGETRHSIANGIEQLTNGGIFCRESPKENKYLKPLGDFQQKPKRGNGERGASTVYSLRDPDIALDYLVATLADNAIRAACYAPPGLPLFTPDHLRTDAPYSLTRAELAAAEQTRQLLLDDYAQEREANEVRIRREAKVLRARLGVAMQAAYGPATPIPDDWIVKNKTDYSAALDKMRFNAAGGFRIEPDRATCAAVGLRNTQQLRRLREKNGIVTDARYKNHAITRGIPVADQVPDYAIRRGWGLHLVASNGDTYEIAHKSKAGVDNWVERQFALGATSITAKEQVSSLERPATDDEKQVIDERIAQRKADAAEYRAAQKGKPNPPRQPVPDETPIHQHSEFYARKQALFGLNTYTAYKMDGDTLVHRATGQQWHDPTVQTLCHAWADTLEHEATTEQNASPVATAEAVTNAPEYVTWDAWKTLDAAERDAVLAVEGTKKFNRQKSDSPGIEWAKWSWNPVTGCLHNCDYCYAEPIAKRFKRLYPQGFAPSVRPERLTAPSNMRVPKRAATDASYKNVFTCSMADLFGKWVPADWINAVLDSVRANPQWNFIFLTKFPIRMAEFDFPDNAWVGTTVDRQYAVERAETAFRQINAAVKFLSCEPMLEPLQFTALDMFDWVIIGGASEVKGKFKAFEPPIAWVRSLEAQARAAGCMIFEKENLGTTERLHEYPTTPEPDDLLEFCITELGGVLVEVTA